MFMYNDFKFFESTVPYTDLIGLYRFNFTLLPFFIKFHCCQCLFVCKKITQINPIVKIFQKNKIFVIYVNRRNQQRWNRKSLENFEI